MGVTCDSRGERVIELDLSGMGLHGFVSPKLGNLFSLERLFLHNNALSGHIPGQLGQLTQLRLLYSNLSGAIPPQLGIITQLKVLGLSQNQLTGQIPWGNQLSGNIPNSLANCSQLTLPDLSVNRLTGQIPLKLCAKLTNLQKLNLSINQLSGHSPKSFSNCSQLTLLDLSSNRLSGTIPLELGISHQLLQSASHRFGRQPSYWHSARLHWPTLYRAQLLELRWQQHGRINSSTDFQSHQLGIITFIFQYLHWPYSPTLGRLQKMEKLFFDANKLEGTIPGEIGHLTGLGLLALNNNMLSGRFPRVFSNLKQLRDLYLHSNHLSGHIPASLGLSWRLEVLDLSDNKLRGKIPPEVAALQNVLFLNLSGNMLEGPLPPEVGKMEHVQAIDISKNRLSGQIPATIESCSDLQSLNLSWNTVQGPIPNSLAQLKNLKDVDLSYNNLSCSIPTFLEKIVMLRHLNLSVNNFSGERPRAGVFTNLTVTSFMGNPGLCGQWLNMHNCSGISLGVAFLSITAVMLFTIHLWRKLRKSERNNLDLRMYMDTVDSRPVSVEKFLQGYASGPTRYSSRQIRKHTNNFRNKLGQGGFGQVFKGKLPNGSLVAKSRQSERQFLNEVATIGRIHQIRLLGYCFQKSKRALAYEYMINGSLEKYIHGSQETHPDHVLDWKQLYSIAIGTARGIAYLHEECANRILHCDIKPHNVLLDASYSPRVADFGLAKLGKREESHMSITGARGTPGYAAPEMWSRNHGPVTDKSDVYCYGMLLLTNAIGNPMFVD
eukprot:Gb_03125 [translate_table: standard]